MLPGLRAPAAEHVVCRRCGAEVNKLVFPYLFYRFGWRGHGLGDQAARERSVLTHLAQDRPPDMEGCLCAGCGRVMLEEVLRYLALYGDGVLQAGQGTHRP